VNDINRDRSDDKDDANNNGRVRRQTCRITNDLDAKACRARKGLAGTAGAQRRHGLSLRIFKMWRYSGRDTRTGGMSRPPSFPVSRRQIRDEF
jgi:hypothetical protein